MATIVGNVKSGPRMTYCRIKYQRKFSYGAIVHLSLVRNKRCQSAKCYRGAAQITCRRARKGVNLKLNPDAHWSSFYKELDKIQFEDGRNKYMSYIINCDDTPGFRRNTTYTHKQHKAVSDTNCPDVTIRTDYVDKYASVLQVTSYLTQATKTTPQLSADIVKPHILHPKDPSQHAADVMHPEFQPSLKNKPIDCIRVDGAVDEGPSHAEVQFMCTERHLEQEKPVLWSPLDAVDPHISTGLSSKMAAWLWRTQTSSFHAQFMARTLDKVPQLIMSNLKETLTVLLMYTLANVTMLPLENCPYTCLKATEMILPKITRADALISLHSLTAQKRTRRN